MASPLITVDELSSIISDPTVRIVDCRWYLGEPDRGISAYRHGHIPGAIYASLDRDLSAPEGNGRHPLPSPATFAATLTSLGITAGTPVIVYDDRGGAVAARLWWMLTDQGHTLTRVLDGGIQAWGASGLPLSTDDAAYPSGGMQTRPWSGVVDVTGVIARDASAVLLDARSVERYRGDEEPVDPKAGHIPGARSLPLGVNLDSELTFLDADSVQASFAAVGVDDATDVIVHCGSGVTACHLILAAESAGLRRPSLYVGSWSDWSGRDLPVATGDLP
jgi:thiosulfate/3-mercaptopyruvate sulfurtransferase